MVREARMQYIPCYTLARLIKNEIMNRVQRKRTKGYKLPENTKCVNRGTKWGNPFKVLFEAGYWVVRDKDGNYWGRSYPEKEGAAEKAVECYSGWIDGQIGLKRLDLNELKGKNLACFCSLSAPCHADYLLELLK
jgi:hypothetical protein